MNKYKETNGTSYHKETNETIINVLENARMNRNRLRVFFGDIKTGRSWDEEHETIGYIGRSTGTFKIPLLVHNTRSFGGGGLLDHCIVKIVDTKTKKTLYIHPKFNQSVFLSEGNKVFQDGKEYAPQCKNEQYAKKLADFMNGITNKV